MSPWFPGLFHGSLADIDSKKWRQKINPAAAGLPGKEEFCRIFAALKRKVVSVESWADQGIPIWQKKGLNALISSKPMRSFESRRKVTAGGKIILRKIKKQQGAAAWLYFS